MDVWEKVFVIFGCIDVLILNVGVVFVNKVNNIFFEEWNKIIVINLLGLFNIVKVFYDDFLINKGFIVYILLGLVFLGIGGGVSYFVSKVGGEGLICGLVKELGLKGVNVNVIVFCLIDIGEMMWVNYLI